MKSIMKSISCSVLAIVILLTTVATPVTAATDTVYFSGAYTYRSYVETRFWEGNVVYNESVFPLENPDGTISEINLMYDADEIISVRQGDMSVEYEKGKDYDISNGNLVILEGGSIPTIDYSTYISTSAFAPKPESIAYWQPLRAGGYTLLLEGSWYHKNQLAITYKHSDTWKGPVPKAQLDSLPLTKNKLENGENLKIVYYGDSITVGANASSYITLDVAPRTPIWTDMVTDGLNRQWSSKVTAVNTAEGGWNSKQGADNAETRVSAHSPDLVFIGFGQNDAPQGISVDDYIENIKSIITTVRGKNPNCEFVLVATMLSNPATFFETWQPDFLPALKTLEADGVIVADMTSIHSYLLTKKSFADTSGNNINHPNDFLSRFYAQVMLTALSPVDMEKEKASALSELTACANYDNYREPEKAQLNAIVSKATVAINEVSTFKELENILNEAKWQIRNLKTESRYLEGGPDYSMLIFDNSEVLDTLTFEHSVNVGHDSVSGFALATVTGEDPYFRVSYPDTKVSADKYKYVTVIYKIPELCTSTTAQLFFTAGSSYNENGQDCVTFTPEKEKYAYKTFDFSVYTNWNGDVHSLRIDPYQEAPNGDTMVLHSITFFETAGEAVYHGQKVSVLLNEVCNHENTSEQLLSPTCIAEGYRNVVCIKCQDVVSHTVLPIIEHIYEKGECTMCGTRDPDYVEPCKGDISGDGSVNMVDLNIYKRYLVGWVGLSNENYVNADINGDGGVDIIDINLVIRSLVGMSVS